MAELVVKSATVADGTFSATGTTVWDAGMTATSGELSLVRGGTGAALVDPGADRILFWDDSAGAMTWLTAGSGLSITGTTIATTGSGTASPTAPGMIPLTGVSYIRGAGNNLATGNNDLYTVPAGKRAWWTTINVFNASLGSIAFYPQIKVGGTYYQLRPALTATTNSASAVNDFCYIAEAGEIISINTATTNGLNVNCKIVEFDDSCSFFTSKLLSLAAGDNTLYTVSSGKSAFVSSQTGEFWRLSGNGMYFNLSGGARSIYWNVVNSGGSVATTNQMFPATNVNNNTLVGHAILGTLSDGDFVNINTNAATATQIAWVNVMEI